MSGANPVPTEERMGLIEVTPIVWSAMENYVRARVELEKRGGARKPELEEARSYAVEALHALFHENPTLCSYRARMDAVAADRSNKK